MLYRIPNAQAAYLDLILPSIWILHDKGRVQKQSRKAASLITAEPELLEKGSVAETIVLGNVILCENVSFSLLSAVVLCAALL